MNEFDLFVERLSRNKEICSEYSQSQEIKKGTLKGWSPSRMSPRKKARMRIARAKRMALSKSASSPQSGGFDLLIQQITHPRLSKKKKKRHK